MRKAIWYELLNRVYDKYIPWEEREITITLGSSMVDRVYCLFHNEEDFKPIEFSEEELFMTNFQIKRTFDDIPLGKTMVMGFGKIEIIKSKFSNEFKIELL